MHLRRHMVCFKCDSQNDLTWETRRHELILLHNVPTYVCPKCGDKSMEICSKAEVERQAQVAIDKGDTEVTIDPEDSKRGNGSCWLCHGERRVEWDGVDDEGNPESGVYDPCPNCEATA